MKTRLIALLVFVMTLLPTPLAFAESCTFESGFKALHDLAPDKIGDCTDNATPQPNGDVQQHTSHGLLVWRKADNWTAFTNGTTTLLNGPCGLAERPNNNYFLWEVPDETGCALAFEEGYWVFTDVQPAGLGTGDFTPPFHLDGGIYVAAYVLDATNQFGCILQLIELDGRQFGFPIDMPDKAGHFEGQTQLGDQLLEVPAGTYAIRADHCEKYSVFLAR